MVNSTDYSPIDGRVIKPAGPGGITLDDRHFQLEDITALTDALVAKSEGRLRELQEAARVIEERIRAQADEGRARIERAMALAQEQIDRQLRETQARAASILEERHRRGYETGHAEGREKGEREGFEQGFADGMSEGLEKGLREGKARGESDIRAVHEASFVEGTRDAVTAVQKIAAQLDEVWAETIGAAREGLLDLAVTIAEGIVRERIEAAPERMVEICERAFDRLERQEQVVIQVHPEDRRWVETFSQSFFTENFEGSPVVKIVENESVGRGGIELQGNRGKVDATISGQLDCARRRLEDAGGMP